MTNEEYIEKLIRRHAERIAKEEIRTEHEEKISSDQPLNDHGKDNLLEKFAFSGVARILGDEWGRKVHERVINKYGRFAPFKDYGITYNNKTKKVQGSNTFYVGAINEMIRPFNIRTATQADLEKILRNKILDLKSNYEDSSLVWRSNEDPNKYLAQDIYNQFNAKKGTNLKDGIPHIFPLYCMNLREDSKSGYGLAFDLLDGFEYFEAPILNSPTQLKFDESDIDEATGFPRQVKKEGSRILYTINSGLCRAYLYRWLVSYSDDDGLSYSDASGWVVCIAAQAADFEKLKSGL